MFYAVLVVLFITGLVLVLRTILREQDREINKEILVMEKLVYLSREEIDTLEAVADRIDTFGHKSDALMLKSLVRGVSK